MRNIINKDATSTKCRNSDLTFTSGDVTYNLVPILVLFFLLYLLRIGKVLTKRLLYIVYFCYKFVFFPALLLGGDDFSSIGSSGGGGYGYGLDGGGGYEGAAVGGQGGFGYDDGLQQRVDRLVSEPPPQDFAQSIFQNGPPHSNNFIPGYSNGNNNHLYFNSNNNNDNNNNNNNNNNNPYGNNNSLQGSSSPNAWVPSHQTPPQQAVQHSQGGNNLQVVSNNPFQSFSREEILRAALQELVEPGSIAQTTSPRLIRRRRGTS